VELQVRNARVTDVEGITTLLERVDQLDDPVSGSADDLLRQLVYLPHATVVVACHGRRVVGAALLALRPSVRHGGMVGTLDLLAVDPESTDETIANALLGQIVRSARNKGCVQIEVEREAGNTQPWLGWGFREAKPHLTLEVTAGALRP
jgi:N-acetylglutamate synthase-like GNAT family acetyltransferase